MNTQIYDGKSRLLQIVMNRILRENTSRFPAGRFHVPINLPQKQNKICAGKIPLRVCLIRLLWFDQQEAVRQAGGNKILGGNLLFIQILVKREFADDKYGKGFVRIG